MPTTTANEMYQSLGAVAPQGADGGALVLTAGVGVVVVIALAGFVYSLVATWRARR